MINENIAVIGAGSWGTALALHLSKKFKNISLWVYENDLCEIIRRERENKWFLSGFAIPQNITPESSLESVVKNKSLVLIAVPTPALRRIANNLKTFDELILTLSKLTSKKLL